MKEIVRRMDEVVCMKASRNELDNLKRYNETTYYKIVRQEGFASMINAKLDYQTNLLGTSTEEISTFIGK